MGNKTNILDSIGNTPLIELSRVMPDGCARILIKLESHNPTGSMKDRMALAVVQGAVRRGVLPPHGTVIEYTGGSTGTSLAFVCAAMGYSLSIVTSDAFSLEKRDHMRALGAHVLELPSEGGKTTKELILRMISKAKELNASSDTFFADQFNNPDAAFGYASMAYEIWAQSGKKIDAFVQSVGTAQCIKGVSGALREKNSRIHVAAVEPAESPVLSGGAPGAHNIEGVGPGFVPPIWNAGMADEIITVSTHEAKEMAQRLAKEEALFAGTSTGANIVAAIQVAKRLGTGHTVVTIACDSGLKYLSKEKVLPGLEKDETRADTCTIRTMKPGDLGYVASSHMMLYAAEYQFDHTFEFYVGEAVMAFAKKFDPEKENLWIAESRDRRMGSIAIVNNGNGVAQLRWLLVEAAARGCGLGEKLVETAVGFAREKKYEKIILMTIDFLTPARRLYEKFGFYQVSSEETVEWGRQMAIEYLELKL